MILSHSAPALHRPIVQAPITAPSRIKQGRSLTSDKVLFFCRQGSYNRCTGCGVVGQSLMRKRSVRPIRAPDHAVFKQRGNPENGLIVRSVRCRCLQTVPTRQLDPGTRCCQAGCCQPRACRCGARSPKMAASRCFPWSSPVWAALPQLITGDTRLKRRPRTSNACMSCSAVLLTLCSSTTTPQYHPGLARHHVIHGRATAAIGHMQQADTAPTACSSKWHERWPVALSTVQKKHHRAGASTAQADASKNSVVTALQIKDQTRANSPSRKTT